jgi:hypothetical protein
MCSHPQPVVVIQHKNFGSVIWYFKNKKAKNKLTLKKWRQKRKACGFRNVLSFLYDILENASKSEPNENMCWRDAWRWSSNKLERGTCPSVKI